MYIRSDMHIALFSFSVYKSYKYVLAHTKRLWKGHEVSEKYIGY